MPMFEANVSLFEVNEELVRMWTSCSAGKAIKRMLGWRRLLYTVVDEMAMLNISMYQRTLWNTTCLLTAGIMFPKTFAGFFSFNVSAYK